MMRVVHLVLMLVVAAALSLSACDRGLTATSSVAVPTATPGRAARIGEIVKIVQARASAAEEFAQAVLGRVLAVGGQVRTLDESKARVDFSEGTIVRLAENTLLTVAELPASAGEPRARFQFDSGKVWVALFGGLIELETPVGTAAIRGSFSVVEFRPGLLSDPNDDVLIVDCVEGACRAQSAQVDEQLGNLERVVLRVGRPPERSLLTSDDVLDFIRNNPEVGSALAATLAAAPVTPTLLPTATATFSSTPTPSPTATLPATPTATAFPSALILGRHVVRGGETLLCIARAYGVWPDAIAQTNGLVSPFSLAVGQILNIPAVQWTPIAPGPVCVPQFVSSYAGATISPTATASPTVTPSATISPTPTPDSSISPTPTATRDTLGPFIGSSSAAPTVVIYPNCTVTFTASIADPSGVASASVVWLSSRSTSGSQAMASVGNTWQAVFEPHVPYFGATTWYVIATDALGNSSSGGGGTLFGVIPQSARGSRLAGRLQSFGLRQSWPDCGLPTVGPTATP